MNTVANIRAEKNEAEARADYRASTISKKDQEIIDYLELAIETEKEAIADCLNVGFFSSAKNKIALIESWRVEIARLKK